MPRPALHLTGDAAADRLVSTDPLALLIGMVLDQQVPLERAFGAPHQLAERLGGELDAGRIAAMDPDAFAALFSAKPALHRFPGSMAKRVQAVCQALVDDYGGRAENVWKTAPSGTELARRLQALPGFGDQKSRIFVALLAKQLGVRPAGWEQAAAPYSAAGHRSVADITDEKSAKAVRTFKQEAKAKQRAAARPAP